MLLDGIVTPQSYGLYSSAPLLSLVHSYLSLELKCLQSTPVLACGITDFKQRLVVVDALSHILVNGIHKLVDQLHGLRARVLPIQTTQ